MYCPKCSQLQSSEEMRFCSRCGFTLAGVAMVVENEGAIPQLPAASAQPYRSSRRGLMTESALFTTISWAVTLAARLLFNVGGPFENVAKIGALLFFLLGIIGLLRFLYGFLFMKDRVDQPEAHVLLGKTPRVGLTSPTMRGALPGQQDLPATEYTRRIITKEMAPPPSVTENTTRLLEEQPTERSE